MQLGAFVQGTWYLKITVTILGLFVSTSMFSQDKPIKKLRQFNGNINYTMIGNSFNEYENSTGICPTKLTESTDDLVLRDGQTIRAAYLFWSASKTNVNSLNDTQVTLNGIEINADETFVAGETFFACRTDITDLLKSSGNGAYTVTDLDRGSPNASGSLCYAGWAILIIYDDPSESLNSIFLFDGFDLANGMSGPEPCLGQNEVIDITLPDLNVVEKEGSSIGFISWEGDGFITCGEDLRFSKESPPLNSIAGAVFDGRSSILFRDTPNMDLDKYDVSEDVEIGYDQDYYVQLSSFQDWVFINAVVVVLSNILPDATLRVKSSTNTCDDRVVDVEFDVRNFDSTDELPVGTNIRFYVNDKNGLFLGEILTTKAIPINELETMTMSLDIPGEVEDEFTLYMVINDDGMGNASFLEMSRRNNTTTELIHIISDPETSDATLINVDCSAGSTASFYLPNANPRVYSGTDEVAFSYYRSEEDAISGENELPVNFESGSTTLFVRVQNATNPCYSVSKLDLKISNSPPITDLQFTICSNASPGVFDLSSQITFFEGDVQNISSIQFYETTTDAVSKINPISDVSNYESGNKTIFVRKDVTSDTGTNCFSISELQLLVNENPVALSIGITSCSQGSSALFDLEAKVSEIAEGANGMEVRFYQNEEEAESEENPITGIYESGTATIYAVVKNISTGCKQIAELKLQVLEAPNFETFSIEECSKNGVVSFDLLYQKQRLESAFPDFIIRFYEDEDSAISGLDPIGDSYILGGISKLYLAAKSRIDDCFIVIPVDLVITEKEVLYEEIQYCEGRSIQLPDGSFVDAPGVYTVPVLNSNGDCDFEVETEVFAPQIDFPTGFTPNSNNVNDCFRMLPGNTCRVAIETYELHIYDRWGDKVWSTVSETDCWKGDAGGQEMPPGLYLWSVKYTTVGNEYKRSGGVTLLR